LARLWEVAMRRADFRSLVATRSARIPGVPLSLRRFVTTNQLLGSYRWTVGGKTGFTTPAGRALVAPAPPGARPPARRGGQPGAAPPRPPRRLPDRNRRRPSGPPRPARPGPPGPHATLRPSRARERWVGRSPRNDGRGVGGPGPGGG